MNYSKYAFGLINQETLKELAKGKTLLPYKKVDGKKDERWNAKLITSKVMQGMISGSTIPDIAKSFRDVMEMNKASSYRNARTSITSCENSARMKAMERAEDMGIKMKKQWMATHDDRTRDSHLALDGETVDIHEKFSNGLMEPADPNGEPEEVYNCRCTMITVVDGVDPKVFNENAYEPDEDEDYYEERLALLQNGESANDASNDVVDVVYGNAKSVLNDSLLSASTEYAHRMHDDDVERFNRIFENAKYETAGSSAYDKLNNVIGVAENGDEATTIFHESTHWFDYNQNYTLTDDYGHIKYNVDDDGNLISKEWIPNITTIKENAGFSEYIGWEWDKYPFNKNTLKSDEFSGSQLDLQNFVKKVGTSDTYGYGRSPEAVEQDMHAISDYLKANGVSRSDPDFVHLSDFISAISYDANLGSLTTGGHDYNYWTRGSEQRVTEIVAGYNLLRATGREDLIAIERDLAPNLMNLIEKEWAKIW